MLEQKNSIAIANWIKKMVVLTNFQVAWFFNFFPPIFAISRFLACFLAFLPIHFLKCKIANCVLFLLNHLTNDLVLWLVNLNYCCIMYINNKFIDILTNEGTNSQLLCKLEYILLWFPFKLEYLVASYMWKWWSIPLFTNTYFPKLFLFYISMCKTAFSLPC